MGYKTILSLLFALLLSYSYAQERSVTFNVNMSYQIEQGKFDPNTETVDVAGDFNGWGSTQTQLFDADDDSIYSITVDGFTAGQTIQFKFRFNFEWGGREEFPGAGNNRTYTVQDSLNQLLVWYNDEIPSTGSPEADFNLSSTIMFEGGIMNFINQSFGEITSYEWFFEGGSPSTSNEMNPIIRYSNAGTFDVQLIVSNETEADTLLKEDVLTVLERQIGETKWWNDRVFYEIFVRSFYDSDGDGIGDFQGIIEKMDYLNDGDPLTDNDLGITGIWLMPINPSPSYHGYDVMDYTAINPDYGTMDDFKEFLALAHDRGIAVIIDLVMNHTSNQHPWFEAAEQNDPFYRDFYRWTDQHPGINGPWGQNVWHQNSSDFYYGLFWGGMPDINYENEAVKDSMFAASDFWINEIGIDGFRQDAVLYIHEDGDTLQNTQKTLDFWQEFNLNMKSNNPDAFNVGEAWQPTDIVLKYITNDRMDYAFEFDLANAIVGSVINEDASSITGQMEYVYNVYPFLQYGTFLTNHDQNRLMSVLEGNVAKNKLAAAMYLTLPGIPYIYYGEEIGQLGVKPDEDIRRPLQWSDELSAGFSTDPSPWRAPYSDFPTKNIEAQQEDPNSLWSTYRDLIKIRNQEPVFRTGEYAAAISNDEQIYAYLRGQDDWAPTLVILNLSGETKNNITLRLPPNLYPSSPGLVYTSETLFGKDLAYTFEDDGSEVEFNVSSLNPYEVSIQLLNQIGLSTEEEEIPEQITLSQNFPNPFNPSTNIQFDLPTASDIRVSVYDIAGRLVSTLADGRYSQGQHTLAFDASNLSSGIYIYRLETQNSSLTKKMTLIK